MGVLNKIFPFNPWQIHLLKKPEQILDFFQKNIGKLSNFIKTDSSSGVILLNNKEEIQPILFNELNGRTQEETNLLKKKATLLYAIIIASRNSQVIKIFLSTIQQCITSYSEDNNILIALFKNAMSSHSPDAIKLFTENSKIKTNIISHLISLEKGQLIDLFKNATSSRSPDAIRLFTKNNTIKTKITTYLTSLYHKILLFFNGSINIKIENIT